MTITIQCAEVGADGREYLIERRVLCEEELPHAYAFAAAELRTKLREVAALCSPSTPVPAISDR